MKPLIVGGLAAALTAGALIAAAPPASAGCQYGGPVISKPAEDCKKIGDFGAWIAARRRVFLENLIIYEL